MFSDQVNDKVAYIAARARKMQDVGDFASAAALFIEVGGIDNRPERASLWHLLAASCYEELGLTDKCHNECMIAINKDQQNASAWRLAGRLQLESGNLQEARSLLLKSNKLKVSASTYLYLSSLSYLENDFDDSARCCRNAIEIDCNHEEAYFHLGRALEQLGRHQEALEAYNESLRLSPDYLPARMAITNLTVD